MWDVITTDKFDEWFDSLDDTVLLCAGCKVGNEKRFYKRMIPLADKEYRTHLNNMRQK